MRGCSVCYVCKEMIYKNDLCYCNNCHKDFCNDICSEKIITKNSEVHGQGYCFVLKECVYCTLDFNELAVSTEEFQKYFQKNTKEYNILYERAKNEKYQKLVKGSGKLTKSAVK